MFTYGQVQKEVRPEDQEWLDKISPNSRRHPQRTDLYVDIYGCVNPKIDPDDTQSRSELFKESI